eukprot:CAMPEP_0168576882 /NCGR_PEP_ID=MMETSP0413-20121227/20489_1 /TAXON_ID=136452 /ORGANISM="Filamoeba nolandi, Strain NC-AS-23-1" /LENGTH=142 /DNA_ID=CAMNT_0008610597 /DNA_START=673 /DNA_END=1101 /DNA_ORIENTATION=+
MIVISTWGGVSLIRIMRQTSQFRVNTHNLDEFGKKLLYYILFSDGVWISAILTLIVYVGMGPTSSQWLWLPCHYLFRAQEAATIFLFCWFIRKKVPEESQVQSTGSVSTLKTLREYSQSGSGSGEVEMPSQVEVAVEDSGQE